MTRPTVAKPEPTIRRKLSLLLLAGMAIPLAGCGGDGAGAQGGGVDGGGEAGAVDLTVLAEPSTLESTGDGVATITVYVKDASNRGVAFQPVEFAAPDRGVVLQDLAARTDENGAATATLRLLDRTVRSIDVLVRSGALSATVTVRVVASPPATSAAGVAGSRRFA